MDPVSENGKPDLWIVGLVVLIVVGLIVVAKL